MAEVKPHPGEFGPNAERTLDHKDTEADHGFLRVPLCPLWFVVSKICCVNGSQADLQHGDRD